MAILSFAHLKNKTGSEKPKQDDVPPSRSISPVRATGNIMSFAHLKKTVKEEPQVPQVPQEAAPEKTRTTYRTPSVMPTALIHAVNYCCGCQRFLPAEEWEGKYGNLYGRCRRDDSIVEALGEDEEWHIVERWEVWKVIPATAIVGRCWFNLKNKETKT